MTLPHSESLEAALIARLVIDPTQIPVVSGSLAPEDFYVDAWRKAFQGLVRLSESGRTVDIESLRAVIGEDADEIALRLGDLTAAHRAPLDEYSRMLKDYAFRRRVITTLQRVIGIVQRQDDREAILADFHDAVARITEDLEDEALISPEQAIVLYKQVLQERAAGTRRGLRWPLASLNEMLQPARGGELILVAARPSVGKTVLAEQIADSWARQSEYPIIFASLEMPLDSILDRTVARESGVKGADIVRGALDEDDTARALDALDTRRNVGLWYLDDAYATTASLRAAAARVRLQAGGIAGIVVDYLQLLKDSHENDVSRVTRISSNLKALAREFNVPVVALSQLSRQPEMRRDSHPRLSDLRESGALEQDADRVLGLWRPSLSSSEAHLDILKARQGITGRIYLSYDGEHFRFTEPTYPRPVEDTWEPDGDDLDHLLT